MTKELEGIREKLEKGVAPERVTVRELLSWFGASRRGNRVVRAVRGALEKHGLDTQPDFELAWIDASVQFGLQKADDEPPQDTMYYRVDSLEAANRAPTAIKPDEPLTEAITRMLAHDFSQLPVMTTEREVKGTISWKSIGSRLSLGMKCNLVRECMDPAVIIDSDLSLFDAIERIATEDYVLVRAKDARIAGIVTATDLAEQFRDLAEPFLLIGEIENRLRRLLHGKFRASQLRDVRAAGDDTRTIEGLADLTLGELLRLLEEPKNWDRLKLSISRGEFVKRLDQVRVIRNDTMHFDPAGIDPAALEELRSFSKFLRELQRLGVTQ